VEAAADAFPAWAALTPRERSEKLHAVADALDADMERLRELEVANVGKPVGMIEFEMDLTVDNWRFFAGGARNLDARAAGEYLEDHTSYLRRDPVGVVGSIAPWNYPINMATWKLGPALAAGNTVVLKPSEITSASAVELARLAELAGIPAGVINVVCGFRETGEALVDHPLVAKVSFTGSVGAGRAIAARAGQRLVSCMLELGGKSPNIVFDDANLDQAEAGVLAGIFAAAGQTCVAGSRAYIHASIYDAFVDRIVRRAQQITIGDPLKATTQMGPVATKMQLEKDESMVQRAVAEGATLLCGGARPALAEFPDGYFYQPTVVHQLTKDNFLMRNEVFGPVLAVTPFKDDAEVLALANDTEFGLAAGVWTHDVRRAHKMARALESGTVWINTYRALTFNSPFGGYKASGIGRQNGIEAIYQYLQTKSVWCELGDEVQDPFVMKV
jgi:acyl-CoA reductase-like NAD-dependent aldehyde dehydrogenase